MPSTIEESIAQSPRATHTDPGTTSQSMYSSSLSTNEKSSHSLSSFFSIPHWGRRADHSTDMQSFHQPPARPYDNPLCPFCLRDLSRERVVDLVCGHTFHARCIKDVLSLL